MRDATDSEKQSKMDNGWRKWRWVAADERNLPNASQISGVNGGPRVYCSWSSQSIPGRRAKRGNSVINSVTSGWPPNPPTCVAVRKVCDVYR